MAKKKVSSLSSTGLTLGRIVPITDTQKKAFSSDKHMVLYGCAGTGKTFISSFLAFEDIFDNYYNKLIILRSAVPTRDMGYLPGTEKEKAAVYEEPYKDIAHELFQRGDAYEILKQKGLVEFMTTSFIRGVTLRDAVIVVDEYQNMSFQELDSIITRVGDNCRIIFCGDLRQADLDANGMREFTQILNYTGLFDFIEFGVDDIVRSGLVKEYIAAKYYIHEESSNKSSHLLECRRPSSRKAG